MIGRPAGNVLLVVLASTFDLDGLCARRTRAQMTLVCNDELHKEAAYRKHGHRWAQALHKVDDGEPTQS